MAGYESILELLEKFNLVAWIVATIGAYFLYTKYPRTKGTKTKGWLLILIGSILVIGRQVIKLLPGYKASGDIDSFLTMYVARYVVGGTGALIITIGLAALGIDLIKKKAHFEG
jgi:hypothetical protein